MDFLNRITDIAISTGSEFWDIAGCHLAFSSERASGIYTHTPRHTFRQND
jgi:hypothetical protein